MGTLNNQRQKIQEMSADLSKNCFKTAKGARIVFDCPEKVASFLAVRPSVGGINCEICSKTGIAVRHIDAHVKTVKHVENWRMKQVTRRKQPFIDSVLQNFVAATNGTLSVSEHNYRMKIVQGCMRSGMAVAKLDIFGDTLFEVNSSYQRLPSHKNLANTYVPLIFDISF